MLVLQLAEHVFVGQSTIGISLFKLETPYADPHVRCCERCDAKTSAYSIKCAIRFVACLSFSVEKIQDRSRIYTLVKRGGLSQYSLFSNF